MILDILYNNNVNSQIVMSYVNDDYGVDLMHFNVSDQPYQFKKFIYADNPHEKLDGFISYDNKPVRLEYGSRFNRFDLMYFINNLADENKKKLLGFRPLKFYSFDIETEIRDGFPDAETAQTPIVSIAISALDDKLTTRVLTIDPITIEDAKKAEVLTQDYIKDNYDKNINVDIKVVQCASEKDLLMRFIEAYRHIHLLGGWNTDGYDWPYIIKRCAMHKLDLSGASIDGSLDREGLPNHKMNPDYMKLFQDYEYSMRPYENFQMTYVAGRSLNLPKLPYDGTLKQLRENDIARFLAYNAIDTIIVCLLHKKHNLTNVLYGLALETTLPMRQSAGAVNQAEAVMFKNYFGKTGANGEIIVCPEKSPDDVNEFQYEGGFVKDPYRPIGKYMACFDYSSLYPSTMRTANLSPMNILLGGRILKQEEIDKVKDDPRFMVSTQGRLYDNTKISPFKEVQGSLYARRKEYQGDQFFYIREVVHKVLHEKKRRGLIDSV